MGMEKRLNPMDVHIQEIGSKMQSMARAPRSGLSLSTVGTSSATKRAAMACVAGKTALTTWASGKTTKCTALESISTAMASATKATAIRAVTKVLECNRSLTGHATKGSSAATKSKGLATTSTAAARSSLGRLFLVVNTDLEL